MSAKKIWAIVISALVVVGLVICATVILNHQSTARELSIAEAEQFLNESFDKMTLIQRAKVTPYIAENNTIVVNSISYGNEKDIIADCSIKTPDVYGTVAPHYNSFVNADDSGTMRKTSSRYKLEFEQKILALLKDAPILENNCKITIYDTDNGLEIYATDEVINAVFGGIKNLEKEVSAITTYVDEEGNTQPISSPNVTEGLVECFALEYSSKKADTSNPIMRAWNSFKADFNRNFIEHGYWLTIVKGLWVTLKLTFWSLIIGIFLGFLVAFVRCTYLKTAKRGFLLKFFNSICQIYLTVIRGTPAIVQITIIYFVVFMPMGVDKFISAVVCFGINSGAYVAEIVRGGIMSVDEGQTEAGRSIGFGYMPTMFYIVFPQAFKAVLPALANEFVVLLKETSIAFYIGLGDIMYAVNAIRAATYTPYMPLIAAALIYLVLVLVLSKLVSLLERRLRNNER